MFEDLLSNFEVLFKARGLSAVHGRLFGALILSDTALSQEQLAKQTSYSIPAVSLSLDELTRLRLIKKTRKRGDRKNYYTTDADLVQIFRKFIESIHDEHVVPFNRTLNNVPRTSRTENLQKLAKNMNKLQEYLEKVLEVRT